ncbi:MAG: hypothetical protein ACM3ZQ_03575 [Bacillota bacterium]
MKRIRKMAKWLCLLLLTAALILAPTPTQTVWADDSGQSYLLTKVFEAAPEGYTYDDKVKQLKGYYEQEIARGMFFDYAWTVTDGLAYWHVVHQYDGRIYEPHDKITEDVTMTYTRPASFGSRQPLTIPFTVGWAGKNKTPKPGSALAMVQVLVFAGDDSYMSQKAGQVYYLDGDDELRATFSYTPDYDYRYVYVYVFSGIGSGLGLGRGYVYELMSDTVTASPTKSNVLVNGKRVPFDAYNINGSNFFKLRDLAIALRGSPKQFAVGWDGERNAISITSKSPAGGELVAGGLAGDKAGTLTDSKIFLDGTEIALLAYNIGGNNYFKLRDLMSKLDIRVGWDDATSTITIDTAAGYGH